MSQLRLFVLLVSLAAQVSIVSTDVTWDSPAAGDIYIPGDTLQVVWTSKNKVISPSFTICTGSGSNDTSANDDPDCGTAVWPSVEQNGTEYSMSLAVPNITGNGDYFLVMKDDQGTTYDTPNFSLALADSTTPENTTSSTSQPAGTSITYVPSHSGSAAAAIAIPLSLVAVILLGALLLLLFRVRRFKREKDKEKKNLEAREAEARSSQSTMSFASGTDIERAIWALSASRGYGNAFSHVPSSANMSGAFAGPGVDPAAATALGVSTLGWARGQGPVAPLMTDAYTPAPVRRFPTISAASSTSRTHPLQAFHSDYAYHQQDAARRSVIKWLETEWQDKDRMLAEESAVSRLSEPPPQLPEIQVRANSPNIRMDIPPPLPPKQLLPGRQDLYAHHAYTHPYGYSTLASEMIPGTETHASLNVISSYAQASPAQPTYNPDMSAPRVPPPSLVRARTLRRLETLQEGTEGEKPLPFQPEHQIGPELYRAV